MLDKSELTANVASDNLSQEEIARFDAMANEWWDPNGRYETALAFNQARIDVMVRQLCDHFMRKPSEHCLKGLSILDVGSGGGLVSENLALFGAKVTGIDASGVSVEVARRHAASTGVNVTYRHALSGDLAREKRQFDVVINAEVVEHVPDQQLLIKECADMVRPGGMLILATLNRTLRSFVIAIVGAEYVMRYLPVGTHDWAKFVKPSELADWTGPDLELVHETGMRMNPFNGTWHTCRSTAVNYLQCYAKDD
ncbi:bifunctional 2-polyprenyl-6-hydroxyphenol methylase/3-demethylubiquinol 3-O-methyltransferase UbiG [Alteromonas sp. CYL-A6]|uniref:bifunctional 2-polyprenyl-6-hydroxyphenol methylase/3-demethylubiquinol 3-O-methyltransferase UbiG n=1 Tax=Alteromonas nitratireducens TaxID=3390813 RepID=UPI0034B1EC10